MHKKHYVSSEQVALQVLSRLNVLVDTNQFSILGIARFDYFEDMITTPIVKDEKNPLKKKRAVNFVRIEGEFPFVMKVVLSAPHNLNKKDLEQYENVWEVERVIIGGKPSYQESKWWIWETENLLWTYPNLSEMAERKFTKKGIPVLLKHFLSQI